jgi:hypothetical protein
MLLAFTFAPGTFCGSWMIHGTIKEPHEYRYLLTNFSLITPSKGPRVSYMRQASHSKRDFWVCPLSASHLHWVMTKRHWSIQTKADAHSTSKSLVLVYSNNLSMSTHNNYTVKRKLFKSKEKKVKKVKKK